MKAELPIKLISYFAPNCPRRIVAPNCPRRIVRAELSCAELSGHRSSFLFPSEQLNRITPSQKVVPKGRPQKYLYSYPLSLVRMWITPSHCGRPDLALVTTLWSC